MKVKVSLKLINQIFQFKHQHQIFNKFQDQNEKLIKFQNSIPSKSSFITSSEHFKHLF